jgi:hypothetical protein
MTSISKKNPAYWKRFHILLKPYGAFNGKAPYEALREKL